MRIAIVGTGISGSLVARLLSTEHDVAVFEANHYPGGHANTVDVFLDGKRFPVDTGFMVFNRRTYPNFCRLLEMLQVSAQPSDMSFSVRCAKTGLEYQGSSLDGLFAQRRNCFRPSFLRMLRDIIHFNRLGTKAAASGQLKDGRTVGEFLSECRVGGRFINQYLVPMASAIWSSSPSEILNFPANFMIGFMANHGLLQIRDRPQWRAVLGGSRNYVHALLEPLWDRIRFRSPVAAIARTQNDVMVTPADGPPEHFDSIVLASHADQSLRMLADPSHSERQILSAFPYQPNEAILHTDMRLLPKRRRAWASWNYHIPAGEERSASVTYNLSRLQNHDSPVPILLTLNAPESIDPAKILRTFAYRHPAYTPESISAQRRFKEINGQNRTYFCGAYWGYGFHEDGADSVGRCPTFWNRTRRMHSCIYEGSITHRRREPVVHQFQHRLFMVYLDLDEVPELVGARGLISDRRFAVRSFLRSDHMFERGLSLIDEVRNVIQCQTDQTSRGPIRLLTQLRYCGYYMSPLNLYYAFDELDRRVEYIVAEVNNTPWNERHCYVLWDGNLRARTNQLQFAHPKQFHVSPFMGMDIEYHWQLTEPSSALRVHLGNIRDSKPLFDARMQLERRELNRQQLHRMTLRYPLMTAQIGAAIYYQALKLWWKKCPFYAHPNKRPNAPSPAPVPGKTKGAVR